MTMSYIDQTDKKSKILKKIICVGSCSHAARGLNVVSDCLPGVYPSPLRNP